MLVNQHSKTKHIGVRVSFANTDKAVIEWIRAITGVGNIVWSPRSNANHKTSGMLMINGSAAVTLITQISSYLKIKQKQADLVVGHFKRLESDPLYRRDTLQHAETKAAVADLNRRGPRHDSALNVQS